MPNQNRARLWVKPVITFDEIDLESAMKDLWRQVRSKGVAPDAIIGIATGGVVCAQMLSRTVEVPIFSCSMSRPSSKEKNGKFFRWALRHQPYFLSNWLRRFEDHLLAWQMTTKKAESPTVSNRLLEDVSNIRDAVEAEGMCHLVVIDDATDSGTTLDVVVSILRQALPSSTSITTAVVVQTRPDPVTQPDFVLYKNTLIRFPWSYDFRGK